MSGERQAQPSLIVLGAGPVGLVAALQARRLGFTVEIWTDRLPSAKDPCRLEVIPAQMIALLVEFGVHPRLLGVERLTEQRLTQWQSLDVKVSGAPPSAHVSRPALELALLGLANRAGVRIRLLCNLAAIELAAFVDTGTPVLDATGRSAATALRIVRPEVPLVSRTFVQPATDAAKLNGFAIAAGPDGYAYRLNNAQQVVLGVVGRGSLLRGSVLNVVATISKFAPWIVTGLDLDHLEPGRAGAASLQWCTASNEGVLPIGDARIARDALASQGLAIGLADALQAVSAVAAKKAVDTGPVQLQLAQHRKRIDELITESPFAAAPEWCRYLMFLRTKQT